MNAVELVVNEHVECQNKGANKQNINSMLVARSPVRQGSELGTKSGYTCKTGNDGCIVMTAALPNARKLV